jgi:phage shock protein A
MWSKLFGKKNKNEANQPTETPQQIIALAIKEIDQAIAKNTETLKQVVQNQKEINTTLSNHQQESERYYKEAMQAAKQGKEAHTKHLLTQKATLDQQIQQYNALYQNLTQTIRQLEAQVTKLRLQKEETRAKEVILSAKLESAKTQKDLQQSLKELDQSNRINLFEQEVAQIETEIQLTNDILGLETAFSTLEGEKAVESIKKEIVQAEIEAQKKREEQQLKKINLLFPENAQQEKQIQDTQKQEVNDLKSQLLNQLLNSQSETKKDNWGTFFEESDKQKKIDDFFKD